MRAPQWLLRLAAQYRSQLENPSPPREKIPLTPLRAFELAHRAQWQEPRSRTLVRILQKAADALTQREEAAVYANRAREYAGFGEFDLAIRLAEDSLALHKTRKVTSLLARLRAAKAEADRVDATEIEATLEAREVDVEAVASAAKRLSPGTVMSLEEACIACVHARLPLDAWTRPRPAPPARD